MCYKRTLQFSGWKQADRVVVVDEVHSSSFSGGAGRVLRLCLQGIGTTKEEIIITFVFDSTL